MGIVTQSAGPVADANFARTIAATYSLAPHREDLGAQYDVILGVHGTDEVHVWAEKVRRQNLHAALRPGDLVLFYGASRVRAFGYVACVFQYPNNVNKIWQDGEPWDCCYTLTGVTVLAPGVPYSALEAVGVEGLGQQQSRYHDVSPTFVASVESVLGAPGWPAAQPRPPQPSPPPVMAAPSAAPPGPQGGRAPGTRMSRANWNGIRATSSVVAANWEERDRANEGHAQTLQAVINRVHLLGLEVSHGEHAWNYDAGWIDGETFCVCEVKSITGGNARTQIRMGLGQVLDYREALTRAGWTVRAYLVIEKEPDNAARWRRVCEQAGVVLTWPSRLLVDVT